jgi:uncharacterized protein (DUF2141 family)
VKKTLFLTVLASLALADELLVTVTHLNSLAGNLRVGLYNSAEHYPIKGKSYKTATIEITNQTMVYKFQDLPDGQYALSLYHDGNTNNVLDKGLFGPIEGYAFSNNVRPMFSAASFEEASFDVKGNTSIVIEMKY